MHLLKKDLTYTVQDKLIFLFLTICLLPTFRFGVVYDFQFLANALLICSLLFLKAKRLRINEELLFPIFLTIVFLFYTFLLVFFSKQIVLAFKEWSFYMLIFLSFIGFLNALLQVDFRNRMIIYLKLFCSFYILILFFTFIFAKYVDNIVIIQNIFGENWNYLAALTLIFLPIVLDEGKLKKVIFYNFLFCFCSFSIIWISNSLAVKIFFWAFMFFHFLNLQKGLPICVILLVILIISLGFLNNSGTYINNFNFHSRYYFFTSSIEVFLNNLFGSGFGAWKHSVFQFDLSDVAGLNYCYFFPMTSSHSLTSKIIVEGGVIVILVYLLILFDCTRRIIRLPLNFLQRNIISSICIFLCLSEFFASLLYYNSRYIGIYLFISILFALFISFTPKGIKFYSHTFKFLIYIIVFFIILFNVDFAFSRNIFYKNTSNLSLGLKSIRNFDKLDYLYRYKRITQIDGFILPFSLAQHTVTNESNYSGAIEYFNHALEISPYSRNVLYHYALYEYENHNFDKSLKLAIKAFKIQNTNGKLNALLVDICIKKKDYKKAQYFLKYLEKSTNMYAGQRFQREYLELSKVLNQLQD